MLLWSWRKDKKIRQKENHFRYTIFGNDDICLPFYLLKFILCCKLTCKLTRPLGPAEEGRDILHRSKIVFISWVQTFVIVFQTKTFISFVKLYVSSSDDFSEGNYLQKIIKDAFLQPRMLCLRERILINLTSLAEDRKNAGKHFATYMHSMIYKYILLRDK